MQKSNQFQSNKLANVVILQSKNIPDMISQLQGDGLPFTISPCNGQFLHKAHVLVTEVGARLEC